NNADVARPSPAGLFRSLGNVVARALTVNTYGSTIRKQMRARVVRLAAFAITATVSGSLWAIGEIAATWPPPLSPSNLIPEPYVGLRGDVTRDRVAAVR